MEQPEVPTLTAEEAEALRNLTLDPELYNPSDAEKAFFKEQTGIQDDEQLREHIIAVQSEVWKVLSISHYRRRPIYLNLYFN